MYFRKLFTLMPVLAAFLSQSCINDNAPCKTSDYGEESLFINIDLSVPVSTRSSGHIDEPGQAAENYIDLEDCKIYIFDKEGKYADLITEIESSMPTDAPNGKYTITAKLELPNKETKEQLSTFNVMVLANCKTFTRSEDWDFDDYSLTGDTKNIYKEGSAFNFDFADLTTSSAWVPTQTEGIPMFGVTTEGVDLQLAIDMGKYGDYPSFSVSMLRALAKIEILDMVPEGEDANIKECVLTKYNNSGRFIPDISENSDWSNNNIQIAKPSLPDGVTQSANLKFIPEKRLVRPEGATEDVEKDCFVVYIPEMDFENTAEDAYPTIEVTIEDVTHTIYLGDYTDGKITEENGKMQLFKHLLRNHNYRFNVVGVGSAEFEFIVKTPWTNYESDEWTYNDAKIEFEPMEDADGNLFSWVNVSQSSAGDTVYPRYEETLSPRTVIISQDGWLEGTFHLTEPAKGIWTLSLYSNDNTMSDRFRIDTGKVEFLNPEDEELGTKKIWTDGGASVSGKVGEEILFRIIPVGANNSSDYNVARLVMTCTTFDDRVMEVNIPYVIENKTVDNMTQPILGESNNDYYYVKQYYTGFGESETDDL